MFILTLIADFRLTFALPYTFCDLYRRNYILMCDMLSTATNPSKQRFFGHYLAFSFRF